MKNLVFIVLVLSSACSVTKKAGYTFEERPPEHFFVQNIDTTNLIEFSAQEGLFYIYKDDYGYYITCIPENHIHPKFTGTEKECQEKLDSLNSL